MSHETLTHTVSEEDITSFANLHHQGLVLLDIFITIILLMNSDVDIIRHCRPHRFIRHILYLENYKACLVTQ